MTTDTRDEMVYGSSPPEEPALTKGEADLLARLREMDNWDEWLLFVNAGFKIEDAKLLQERGLIETSRQAGMPAARMWRSPINRCDKCDNGIQQEWDYCAWCGHHLVDEAGN